MPVMMNRRSILGVTATLLTVTSTMRAAWGADSAAPGEFIADRLAGYADGLRFSDLDAATVEAAKAHLIDALGCAMVALDEEPVRICREVALLAQGGVSTIFGTDKKTTMDLAAFANGVAVRYFDFNDLYVGKEPGHPSDLIPVCLAVGEAERASGQDLLTAIVLTYEINCRLLDAAPLTVHGWDHPVYSLPAAALAAGKLMRLGPLKLAQAINLAISGHLAMNQTRVQVLSDWKGVANPDAARNGVFAAMLAKGGLTGPAPIFEGRAGLFRQVSGELAIDTGAFGGRGTRFKILDCSFKLYPTQGYSLTAIPAGIAVAHEAGGIDRITKLVISTTRFGYISAGSDPEKWTPQTRDTADHSLPYIVARAMIDGDISNASFTTDKITDPRIRAFMKKITVQEDPALTGLLPKAVPNRVTATLDDGRIVSKQVDDLPGFAGRRMERGDVEQKFRKNVAGILSDQNTKAALDAFWNLDRQSNASHLVANLLASVSGRR